jgi:hypothetical protein
MRADERLDQGVVVGMVDVTATGVFGANQRKSANPATTTITKAMTRAVIRIEREEVELAMTDSGDPERPNSASPRCRDILS